MGHERFANWAESRDYFERVAESLIQRIWATREDGHAFAIDGRGGDGGLDVFVERNGVTVEIYQLKFFPEGMSGGWAKTRRAQVRRSFESIAKTPGLERWTLVMPRNPTNSELRFVRGLGSGSAVEVAAWGRAELDQRISRFPDLLQMATREPLVDTLREAGLESSLLVAPHDLQSRLQHLSATANSRSLYWGTDFSVRNGVISESFFAKRPDAAEKEPISISFTASFGADDNHLREQYERLLRYGGTESVRLPPEVVGVVRKDGPKWFAEDLEGLEVELAPVQLASPTRAELRVTSQGGVALANLKGSATHITRGLTGFTLKAKFPALEALFRGPVSGNTEASLRWSTEGCTASQAQSVARLLQLVAEGHELQVCLDDQLVLSFTGDAARTSPKFELPPGTRELIGDLAFLEREYGLEFGIPRDLTPLDVIDVRVIRMLAEGRATTWPRIGHLSGTFSENLSAAELAEHEQPRALFVRLEEVVFNLLGQALSLGTVGVYHPSMRIDGLDQLLSAAASNGTTGMTANFVATDGTPPRVWRTDKWDDPEKLIIPEPWNIPDVAEDRRLALITGKTDPAAAAGPTN